MGAGEPGQLWSPAEGRPNPGLVVERYRDPIAAAAYGYSAVYCVGLDGLCQWMRVVGVVYAIGGVRTKVDYHEPCAL